MEAHRYQRLLDYTIAFGALGLALAARWAMTPALADAIPFLPFYAAVLLTAAFASMGPALLALVAGGLLGGVMLPEGLPSTEALLFVIRYLAVSGGIVILAHLLAQTRGERLLAEGEQRFRALVEQIQDYAIFMIDKQGRATSWNEGVQRVLGFQEKEFVGNDVATAIFTPEDLRDGVPEREFKTAAMQNRASDDRWMLRKDRTRIFVLGVTVARRGEDGALLGYAKIMRDQTEHKRLEDQLRETAEQLARINRRQTDFLAMLSHEIRNPLASLRNGLDLIRLHEPTHTRDEPTLAMMDRQFVHLVKLVDDLLDASRITSGKIVLRKEPIELRATIAHAVEVCEAQCKLSEQMLKVAMTEEPIYVDADPTRMVQIVANLLHNACKFTPKGGRIEVAVYAEADDAVIRILDTGIGIPPHYLHRIFNMFEQIERPLANQSGLGIGLGLAKSLVEMHGGTIQAVSAGDNQGSEFVIRLPRIAAPVSSAFPASRGARPAGQALRILAVDDNRDAVDSLAIILELDGHTVCKAYTGRDAIEDAKAFRADVALVDIGLPDISGHDVARALRREQGAGVTLIALTGWGQDEDVKASRGAGFDEHLTKPIAHEDLQRILATVKPLA